MSSPTVYFDGLCPLCSREIEHYRRRVPAGSMEFVDIADPTFDPVAHGVDPVRVNQHMHAKVDGKLFVGVDAFRAIWAIIPGFRWLRRLTGLPLVYPATKVLYSLFARVRPWLPKRKSPCANGRCRI